MNDKTLLILQLLWRVVALLLATLPVTAVVATLYFKNYWLLLLVPAVPLAFVALAKKTCVKTTHYSQPHIQRYRLPDWLAWAETPDEHLPGGLYEPTVKKIYDNFGWVTCAIYWMLLRNVGQGILWPRGKLVGAIYDKPIDHGNEDILKAVKAQVLVDHGLTETYWFIFRFYYELVHDWYGEKSGVADDNWRTGSYVAVLRLGLR